LSPGYEQSQPLKTRSLSRTRLIDRDRERERKIRKTNARNLGVGIGNLDYALGQEESRTETSINYPLSPS
jgi:hypothetical protein